MDTSNGSEPETVTLIVVVTIEAQSREEALRVIDRLKQDPRVVSVAIHSDQQRGGK